MEYGLSNLLRLMASSWIFMDESFNLTDFNSTQRSEEERPEIFFED